MAQYLQSFGRACVTGGSPRVRPTPYGFTTDRSVTRKHIPGSGSPVKVYRAVIAIRGPFQRTLSCPSEDMPIPRAWIARAQRFVARCRVQTPSEGSSWPSVHVALRYRERRHSARGSSRESSSFPVAARRAGSSDNPIDRQHVASAQQPERWRGQLVPHHGQLAQAELVHAPHAARSARRPGR